MNQSESLRARAFRRLWVNLSVGLIFLALLIFFFAAAKELILPTILGGFLGYLFRPMVALITGPPMVRLSKSVALLLAISGTIYLGVRGISASLPNEKEQLELLVRLQYRLNLRYSEWMGLNVDPRGNWVHSLVGKEIDPLVKQMNQFLSLGNEQRKTFMLYRRGHNGLAPVKDKYYDYFLANLKIIKESQEEAAIESTTESSMAGTGAVAKPKKTESSGLGPLLKTFSIWLAFPLVFIFVLLDKGQIQQFALKLVPNRYFELSRTIMDEVDNALGHYIRGTVLECLLVGLTISIGLWLCGFAPNIFILVGLVGGVTNAIPFLGPALAFAVGSVFALIAENISPLLPFITLDNLFIAVMVVVAIAQLLDNAVYQPVVVGGAVNIHPLAVILGVLSGSLVFGFAGLLLAIPTIVIFKVVTETLFHELKAYKII